MGATRCAGTVTSFSAQSVQSARNLNRESVMSNRHAYVAIVLGALTCGAASAQEVALSFTASQVAQGRAVYDTTCVMCHGTNLDDGPLAAPLKGDAFMRKYGGKPARALFDVLRTTMPTGNPGSLSAETYAALTALILEQNDIVPGATPLPADPQAVAAMQVPAGGFSFMAFSPYTARPAVDRATPLARFNAVTDDAIAAPPAGDWLGWRRSYDAQGFSPLREIDTRNVADLRLAWSWTLPAGSAESVPLVRDGTIFVQAYGDIVQALDAHSGDLLWQ